MDLNITTLLPMSGPADALEVAQPPIGLGGRERPGRKLACQYALAVQKEPHFN